MSTFEELSSPAATGADDIAVPSAPVAAQPNDSLIQYMADRERGMRCGRCDQYTGNNHQGHYWKFCSVTKQMEVFHFCCPGDCGRATAWKEQYQKLVDRFAELGITVDDRNHFLVPPKNERWISLLAAAKAMDEIDEVRKLEAALEAAKANPVAASEDESAPVAAHNPTHAEVDHLAQVLTTAHQKGIFAGTWSLARWILAAGYRRDAQPRYVLDRDAILELVGRYAAASVEEATSGSPKGREAARDEIRDLWDAICAALTPVPAAPPRRWEVGSPQPGRSVIAVRDRDGDLWDRMFGDVGERLDAWTAPDDPEITISWGELLSEFGPLDDATNETPADSRPRGAADGPSAAGNGGADPDPRTPGTGSADLADQCDDCETNGVNCLAHRTPEQRRRAGW